MIFKEVLDYAESDKVHSKIHTRKAVRAVILKGDKLLMVHSNRGDYKFPGGGVNPGENDYEALIREVEEETGYLVKNIEKKIGMVLERKEDEFDKEALFEMESHYYACEVEEEMHQQNLDEYEKELDFYPAWISLKDALENNKLLLNNPDINPWTRREIKVLSKLL
ncbi:NUDIX domain-containing protein [Clostridium sp. 19966]|uniref:NUDIX hydrolase n=1 Tax=Clostridium sp. 19966 TaxID=2768166 RepID=UPI0028DE9727|nr:NUDIX domain-containing protein [Clostridium sp. 19966]MDT8717934.1 NUDIX domain-containing protein [Clostridium sp. 19966]